MASAEPDVGPAPETPPGLDSDSVEWLRVLAGDGRQRDAALTRLHELLRRVARGEMHRRGPQHRITGPEFDDLADQAAADALLTIAGKLGQFRGDSRFTTWAYKFVILEVSAKIGRHFWRHHELRIDGTDWDRLPDRLGVEPGLQSEWRELAAALRAAVEQDLTPRQRDIFIALVLDGVPLDAVAARLGSTRGAIYKVMCDARRKLRAALTANGYLQHDTGRRP